MHSWKIYYDNGSVFTDLDGPPEDAPCRGVVALFCQNALVNVRVLHCKDFYVYLEYGWEGVDHFGLWDYLSEPGFKIVKFGRWIDIEEYRRILHIAFTENEPKKSGLLREEKRGE